MGSSKKHKEKDRERESRKRHHRSRSRSPKSKSTRDKKDKRDRSRDRKKRETYGSRGDENYYPPEKIRIKEEKAEEEELIGSGTGNDNSLSIEETNKLRIKLGLKPLDVSSEVSSSKDKKDKGDGDDEKKDVHVPAQNLGDKQYLEKLREKIAIQREKRRLSQKLSKVKGLGDSDSEDDTAAAWVEKSRKIQIEKEKADKRAKLLEEMDEEFGIGSLVEDEFKSEKEKMYTSKDLRGMKVEHAKQTFKEGSRMVLILKDKGVLEEDDDVLVNMNVLDDEKAAKNVEVKKKKPDYVAYDEEETDVFGQPKKTLLSKYDEEIDGIQKKSFQLGFHGMVDVGLEDEAPSPQQKLKMEQMESLLLPVPSIASEYYTEAEMVTFKKPKKRVRKIRKTPKPLKADEILPIPGLEDDGWSDLGSRTVVIKEEPFDWNIVKGTTEDSNDNSQNMEIDKEEVEDTEILGPEEDLSKVILEPDEAELELQLALNKARKLKQKEDLSGPEKVVTSVSSVDDNSSDQPTKIGPKGSIVMNATAEFCRALGDIPTYGLSGNRDEDVDELLDFERELIEERRKLEEEAKQQNMGAWNEVGIDEKPVEIKTEDAPILEEEPDVGKGMAGALKLAMKKGYLEDEVKKVVSAPRHSQLQAASYTIEDKSFFDDDKYGRRDRYSGGPVTDFKEKDTYRPDIKLEYIDDSGRLLKPKEAFRYLSHKFHGKGSGKNKTEKRMKKLQEEALMKQMSSTDTPLGTLALLQEKQRQTQSPYILLSGGSKALTLNAISKPV